MSDWNIPQEMHLYTLLIFKMKLCFGSWMGGKESESYQATLAPFVVSISIMLQTLSYV